MQGLIIYANNCEDVEAIGTTALLKRAGLNITTATFERFKKVNGVYGTVLEVDYFVDELNLADFDFLIIPGGSYVAKTYNNDLNYNNVIMEFNQKNKLIAAICAGPMFLGEAGLLQDKNYTIFPGCEKEYFGGKLQQYHKVVSDKNIITARSVGAVVEFVYEIVKHLKGHQLAEDFLKNIYF